MKLAKSLISGGCVSLVCASQAAGIVLNFDEFKNLNGVAIPLPANYGGFTWDANFYVYDTPSYQSGYFNTYGAPSAPNFVFNAYGVVTVQTTSGAPFNFISAEFSTWASYNQPYYDDLSILRSSLSVTVNGYSGATLVGSASLNLIPTGFSTLTANLNGVDRLEFVNDGVDGHWWIMDNFTYEPVPEPRDLAIAVGFGLLGLAAFRRFRS